MQRRRTHEEGFTLLELMVVLVILGLLAATAAPQVMKYLGRAKTDAAALQVRGLGSSLDMYRLDVGGYPSQAEGLQALVQKPSGQTRWAGPYIAKKEMLVDPWGRSYQYRYPGERGEYELFTLGADNAVGGDGENRDVTSW
ncbi:MAG TPA: type II secretion system major pseudopilin GspG [Azospirillum sp.]|nr:type II secretion system major pseudopilin GspG [Azospirillum sp.]